MPRQSGSQNSSHIFRGIQALGKGTGKPKFAEFFERGSALPTMIGQTQLLGSPLKTRFFRWWQKSRAKKNTAKLRKLKTRRCSNTRPSRWVNHSWQSAGQTSVVVIGFRLQPNVSNDERRRIDGMFVTCATMVELFGLRQANGQGEVPCLRGLRRPHSPGPRASLQATVRLP